MTDATVAPDDDATDSILPRPTPLAVVAHAALAVDSALAMPTAETVDVPEADPTASTGPDPELGIKKKNTDI